MIIRLGVNIDHVATLREVRKSSYPDPLEAAFAAIAGGADQITIHLREDRRHISDSDLARIRERIRVPLNLEMAANDEIIEIACKSGVDVATLVPERRMELTTEGGLDVHSDRSRFVSVVGKLKDSGISVSMFIDPDLAQVDASCECSADRVEFHTGAYCDARDDESRAHELARLIEAVQYASKKGLIVCAGHGLNYTNIGAVVRALPEVLEYNIGHSIVARSIVTGIEGAVSEMKRLIAKERS